MTMRPSPKGYSPNVMGLASLGQRIGIFCDSLYSVLLFNAILGLDFLGLALSWPQVDPADPFLSHTPGAPADVACATCTHSQAGGLFSPGR